MDDENKSTRNKLVAPKVYERRLQEERGLIGIFEPIFFTQGNVLWILDRTQGLPEDFEPVGIAGIENQILRRAIAADSSR